LEVAELARLARLPSMHRNPSHYIYSEKKNNTRDTAA